MNIILSVETNNKNGFYFFKIRRKDNFASFVRQQLCSLDLYLQSVLFRPRKGFDVTLLHKIE